MSQVLLGVNIDHVATLRQARGTDYPDPVEAALVAEQAGADGITLHLREDRRHIVDQDVHRMKAALSTRMNLEMAATEEMVRIACDVKPAHCCIVPERREELTTEGGLNVIGQLNHIRDITRELTDHGIDVSLFIDPDAEQIRASHEVGAPTVELHTGAYAEVTGEPAEKELSRIKAGMQLGLELGLTMNAGHGLNVDNVAPVAQIPGMHELNIGHAIVARSVFIGLPAAVAEMKALINQ